MLTVFESNVLTLACKWVGDETVLGKRKLAVFLEVVELWFGVLLFFWRLSFKFGEVTFDLGGIANEKNVW